MRVSSQGRRRTFYGIRSGNGTLADHLASFTPKPGDAVFIPAGTVHSLGGDVMVFEIQQNSDVTFRLYDWGHIDPKTGKPRALQVEQAGLHRFCRRRRGPGNARSGGATPEARAALRCEAFLLWRLRGAIALSRWRPDSPRVLVCIEGKGQIEHDGEAYAVGKGEVWLLPAVVGVSLSARAISELVGNCIPAG